MNPRESDLLVRYRAGDSGAFAELVEGMGREAEDVIARRLPSMVRDAPRSKL